MSKKPSLKSGKKQNRSLTPSGDHSSDSTRSRSWSPGRSAGRKAAATTELAAATGKRYPPSQTIDSSGDSDKDFVDNVNKKSQKSRNRRSSRLQATAAQAALADFTIPKKPERDSGLAHSSCSEAGRKDVLDSVQAKQEAVDYSDNCSEGLVEFKAKPVPKHVYQPVFQDMMESQPKR